MTGWADLPTDIIIDLGNDTKYSKVVDKDKKWIGINEWHLNPNGELCGGWVPFDVKSDYINPNNPTKWTVESYEPLTLSPSLQCTTCGHHGHIRNNRWEPC